MPGQCGTSSPIWWSRSNAGYNSNNWHSKRRSMGVSHTPCETVPRPGLLRLDSTGSGPVSSDEDSVTVVAQNHHPRAENPETRGIAEKCGIAFQVQGCKTMSELLQHSGNNCLINKNINSMRALTSSYSSHRRGHGFVGAMSEARPRDNFGNSANCEPDPARNCRSQEASISPQKRSRSGSHMAGRTPPFRPMAPSSSACFPHPGGHFFGGGFHATCRQGPQAPRFGSGTANVCLSPDMGPRMPFGHWPQLLGAYGTGLPGLKYHGKLRKAFLPVQRHHTTASALQQRAFQTAKKPSPQPSGVKVTSDPVAGTDVQDTLSQGLKTLSVTSDSTQDDVACCKQGLPTGRNQTDSHKVEESPGKYASVAAENLKEHISLDSFPEDMPSDESVAARVAIPLLPASYIDESCLKTGAKSPGTFKTRPVENEKSVHKDGQITPSDSSSSEEATAMNLAVDKNPPGIEFQQSKKKKKSRPSLKKRQRQKLQRNGGKSSKQFVTTGDQNPAVKRPRTSDREQNGTCDCVDARDSSETENSCQKTIKFSVASAKSDSDCIGAKCFVIQPCDLQWSDSDSEWENQDCDKVNSLQCLADTDFLLSPVLSFCSTEKNLNVQEEEDSGPDEAVRDANSKWNSSYPEPLTEYISEKVHFAPEKSLLTVHHLNSWSLEVYMEARRGPWEEYARDRQRFHNRIQNTEKVIGSCLTPSHRSHMYSILCQDENS